MSHACQKYPRECEPLETGCFEGYEPPGKCPHFASLPPADAASAPVALSLADGSHSLLWTGRAHGTASILPVAGCNYVNVIGLVGAHDAGKTTFLSSFYLLLLRDGRLGRFRFAGSTTLAGWERLATPQRYTANHPPTFPPHTSSSERTPGLLHLALRDENGNLRDVVFADAPGEWFTRWSVAPDEPSAEGARWIAQKADGFVLFADSAAFAGSQFGGARGRLIDLMRRLGYSRRGRPVEFVWAKSDIEVRPQLRDQIEAIRKKELSDSMVRSVSALAHDLQEEIRTTIAELLNKMTQPTRSAGLEPTIISNDPFLAYRFHR